MRRQTGNTKAKQRNCLVCRKPMAVSEACFRMKHKKTLVFICCPLCFEAFEEKPAHYLSGYAGMSEAAKRMLSLRNSDFTAANSQC